MVKKQIAALIGAFIIAIITFAILPEVMNSAAEAKANPNVTDSQGIFVDLIGLLVMIGSAIGIFNISLGIKLLKE